MLVAALHPARSGACMSSRSGLAHVHRPLPASMRPCEKFPEATDTGFDDLFNAIATSMRAMKVRPPNLSDIMLEPESDYVFNEMDRQLNIAMKREQNDDWQDKHIDFLTSKGIRINAPNLAKSTEKSPWVATLLEREKAVLKYAQHEKQGPCSVDLSQSPGRLSFVKSGVHGGQVAPTLIEHTHTHTPLVALPGSRTPDARPRGVGVAGFPVAKIGRCRIRRMRVH